MGIPRRSNLFLVRLSARVAVRGSDKVECHGRVLEMDGQSYQFDSWQGLVDLLAELLSSNKGR